jgi:threonine dehydratase
MLVPVGAGTGASAACVAGKAISASMEVIGVQSDASPAAHRSWAAHRLENAVNRTRAEGLATGTAFALAQSIMWTLLDDLVLVSDDALEAATRTMIEATRNLVEPAGAAGVAAILADPGRFAGRKVAVVCTGGNISPAQLVDLFQSSASASTA